MTGTDEPRDDGTSAPYGAGADWIIGLVLAATGGLLALTGLTLPWAATPPTTGGVSQLVPLADLNPLAGPLGAFILSTVGVGVALSFSSRGPWATMVRLSTMAEAVMGSVAYLFFTAYLTVWKVLTGPSAEARMGVLTPSMGCYLYCGGLIMIGLGVAGSPRLPSPTRPGTAEAVPAAARMLAHRVCVGVALAAAVASAALPPYRTQPSRYGSITLDTFGPGPGDVRTWFIGYRVGLAVCLLIVVLALVRPAAARRLRGTGLAVGVAVTTALLMGYLVLWLPLSPFLRRDNSIYATLHPGAGYHLGVVSVLVLTASFLLLPGGPDERRES